MTLSREDFDHVRALVLDRSAIVLDGDKFYLAETRLLTLARREGFASPTDLVARMRAEPCNGLQQLVVEAIATNETSFFRDVHPFDALRQEVFPTLLRSRPTGDVQVWCAACSSGQEPYSIALLLHENFALSDRTRVRILASDLSNEMLERARQGRFNQFEIERGLPAPYLTKYFKKRAGEWELEEKVRRQVDFRQINLKGAWPVVPSLDVILLRNVLIYFDMQIKKQILAKVRQVLRPQGYLFLGGAETTLYLDDAFERVQIGRTSCYRLRA